MSSTLSKDSLFTVPQRHDWHQIDNLSDIVAVPAVTLEDLETYGYSPDELREEGHDVPEDDDEAFAYAIERFRESDAYPEWEESFFPAMSVFWPCQTVSRPGSVEAFRREGLACGVVSGKASGIELHGIILTGAGMDLSDHIAAAYILSGQVPPIQVLESALRIEDPKMEDQLLEAAAAAVENLENTASSFKDKLEARRGAFLRP